MSQLAYCDDVIGMIVRESDVKLRRFPDRNLKRAHVTFVARTVFIDDDASWAQYLAETTKDES